MWTIVEMNMAIICACLPQVRTLLAGFFPELLGSQVYRISQTRKRAHGGSMDVGKILTQGEGVGRSRISSNGIVINFTGSKATTPTTSGHGS